MDPGKIMFLNHVEYNLHYRTVAIFAFSELKIGSIFICRLFRFIDILVLLIVW